MISMTLAPADLLTQEGEDIPSVDALLYRRIVSFGSLPPARFVALCEEKVALYGNRIQAWIGEEGERVKPLAEYRRFHAALHSASVSMQAITSTLGASTAQLINENTAGLIAHREQALLSEAQLQAYEGSISAVELTHIQQAVGTLDPVAESVRVTDLCIAVGETVHALSGVLIFTTQQALDTPDAEESALLFMPGKGGGLQKFSSLQALKDDVQFTLQSGLDTPFWRHVSASSRGAAMGAARTGPLELITRVTTAPAMTHSVHVQIESLEASIRAATDGQRFFDDASNEEATLSRLYLESADNLQVHRNDARDQAIDRVAEQQRTGELVAQMPQWLLHAPVDVRREHGQRLSAYHAAAALLERELDAVLPSFEAFTRQTLAARIKDDLGIDVDADQVFIDLPESATRDFDIDPQYGVLRHGNSWSASAGRVRFSVAEWARYNIDPKDEEMTARLTFARIDSPAGDLGTAIGLTVDYISRIIPLVNIAAQYRALLGRVFQTRTKTSPLITPDVLLKPYELEILLEGFAALQEKRLSAHGYRVLEQAVQARSNADLHAAQLRMSWVVLNPGHAVSGETKSATLSGLCVIHHETTGTTLVYLPQAPTGVSLIEAMSLQEAKARLINKLINNPPLIEYLVSRAGEEGSQAANTRYIEQALLRKFDGFITFTPALFLKIAAQQVDVRARLIHVHTKLDARSNADIRSGHDLRESQAYMAYFKAILSFLPGMGTLFSVHDGWNDGHSAAAAFREGRTFEGEVLTASASLSVLDILLSVVPGVATVAAFAKVARRATKLRQAARLTGTLPSVTRKRYVLTSFKGYEADVSPVGASKQNGVNAGTALKDGQLWIQRQGKFYKVYRRKGEQSLRLQKTVGQGYEPPVRLDSQGDWVYHMDVGLKGGVKSSIAETLISEAHPDGSFTRKQARELLDQFAFPVDQQRRLELDVAVHYQSHRAVPGWAEAHRRQPQGETVAPLPIPVASKRKQPAPSTSETNRQPPQPVPGTSRSIAVPADNWKGWGQELDELTVLEPIGQQPPIFRVTGAPEREVVVIGRECFDILPAGSTQSPSMVFLRNPAAGNSRGSFAELNEVIRVNPFDQPVMASFKAGQWTVHGPLFSKKIQSLIADIRPAFTPISQRVLAEKLYQLADSTSLSMTATRLINMKATLNAWRKGHAAPLAKLNDPLTMLDGARPTGSTYQSMNISYESSLDTFHRLDFLPGDPSDLAKLRGGADAMSAQELSELMTRQLTSSGYELLPGGDLMHFTPTLTFQRPGLDKLYMMSVRRVHNSQVAHELQPLPLGFPLSSTWLDAFLDRYAGTSVATRIAAAQEQGSLIRLVGGTNTTRVSGVRTQLFVVRVADDI
ncbi:hypothetical protein QN412_18980 [Pseudomonas sp. RTB3]|uniref:dermonecrotic toxin domain-containing protein n=1 Tax=unclassified Pseudomonas TaxID=196821 RepID=UPI002B230A63|nr:MULTISPECIES: DUF6543 domain-containing protein [unclassified Pseudomonas]MEB0007607.1 hypothetical protein [Pseudomonas sp. RTB2]MEB0019012.1 hypothetical protein [Pseudomonas sp. RTB3]MEB0271061.1 hypothetical protein [Pseudomonas sp. 5B4]